PFSSQPAKASAWAGTNCFSKSLANPSSLTRGKNSTTQSALTKLFWSCATEYKKLFQNSRKNSIFKKNSKSLWAEQNGRIQFGMDSKHCRRKLKSSRFTMRRGLV